MKQYIKISETKNDDVVKMSKKFYEECFDIDE